MKKLFTAILVGMMILSVVGCSSGVSQEEYDKVVKERDNAVKELELANTSIAIDALADSKKDTGVVFMDSAAATLDINSECVALNEDVVQITIPSYDGTVEEFSQEVSEWVEGPLFTDAFISSLYKAYIVMALDDTGLCRFGISVARDGGNVVSDVFISSKTFDAWSGNTEPSGSVPE